MAGKRKVIWTETASKEFKETLDYWNERNASKAYSKKLRKLVNGAIKRVLLFPKSGVPAQFENLRFVVIRDYLLFYQETPDRILIISFWDGRQDPGKLKNRLK